MKRFSYIFLLAGLMILIGCEGLLTHPDEVADDFAGFINDKDYLKAFFLLSEERRATIDTNDIFSVFDFSSQIKDKKKLEALMKCEGLLAYMKDSALFSCQKDLEKAELGSYNMMINTYDPEALIQKAIKELEKDMSLVDLYRYYRMSDEDRMKLLDETVVNYINNNPNVPRKDIAVPFKVVHNGVRYVIE